MEKFLEFFNNIWMWVCEMWAKIQPYMNWEFLSKWIGYVAAVVSVLCLFFALLAKSKNKKIAKFATNALAILQSVKTATEKAEQYAGATGEQKKEIATTLVKNELAEAGIKVKDEQITEAITKDVDHTNLVNVVKANEVNVSNTNAENRTGLEL